MNHEVAKNTIFNIQQAKENNLDKKITDVTTLICIIQYNTSTKFR